MFYFLMLFLNHKRGKKIYIYYLLFKQPEKSNTNEQYTSRKSKKHKCR